jgi:hypothetical protein
VTDLPFYAIPVIVADEIRLRIYTGGNLKVEMPLRRRQALVLAAQLLNYGLMTEGRLGRDPLELDPADEQWVATRLEGRTHE